MVAWSYVVRGPALPKSLLTARFDVLFKSQDIQRQLRYPYCAANKLRASFSRCSKDIQRQLRYQYCAANKLRASFSRCSNAVKNVIFRSFCTPMYASQLWCNFRKSWMQRLRVAYNFGCRARYNLHWRASVSSHDSSGSI